MPPHTAFVVPLMHVPLSSQQPIQFSGPQGALQVFSAVHVPSESVQSTHSPPPEPQALSEAVVTHSPAALQQPSQLSALQGGGGTHSFSSHSSPLALSQTTHAVPPEPQALLSVPLKQAPLLPMHPSHGGVVLFGLVLLFGFAVLLLGLGLLGLVVLLLGLGVLDMSIMAVVLLSPLPMSPSAGRSELGQPVAQSNMEHEEIRRRR